MSLLATREGFESARKRRISSSLRSSSTHSKNQKIRIAPTFSVAGESTSTLDVLCDIYETPFWSDFVIVTTIVKSSLRQSLALVRVAGLMSYYEFVCMQAPTEGGNDDLTINEMADRLHSL